MIAAAVAGVSVWGPGLEGWSKARDVLRGTSPFAWTESAIPPPALLAANERRRTGPVVRLALEVAREAVERSGLEARALRVVFGSSNGDSPVVHDVLEAVTTGDRPVSPTQFHNSVHNAAAGYWSIATGATTPATSLGCYDDTVAASLLKAVLEVSVEERPVLVCMYDVPVPGPLGPIRRTDFAFGAGLVLAPAGGGHRLPRIAVDYRSEPAEPADMQPRVAELHDLLAGNPAARVLRLLEALAREETASFALPYLDGRLAVTVTPR